MTKKSNIILSILLVSFFISVWSIGVNQYNPSTQIKKQDDDIITELTAPETSGYAVTEKWKWNNSFTGNPNAVQVEISMDGNYIVTRWGGNPNVTLHKQDSNETIWIYEGASNIYDVAISGNGQYIVLSNGSHVICLDNLIGTPKTALWEYDVGSNCFVDISLTGDYISAVNDTHVFLLDENGQLQWAYDSQTTIDIGAVAISGDGRYIITGFSSRFYLFNTTDYEGIPMWSYYHAEITTRVALSDDGRYAVASNDQNSLWFFNTTLTTGGKQPMWYTSIMSSIYDVAISSDGKNIAVAGSDEHYYFNNTFSTGEKQPMWSYDPDRDATSIDITADGKYVLGGSDTINTAYLFNNSITNPKEAEWSSSGIDINDVAISGWGNYFVIGTDSEEIILFHHDRPIPIEPSGYDVTQRWNDTSNDEVTAVAVSANGKYMAVGTQNLVGAANILFYNTSDHNGRPMWNYTAPSAVDRGLAISADGKYIVAGCGEALKVVLLNSTVTNPKTHVWSEIVGNTIGGVDISADGKKIVYGGHNGGTGAIYVRNILGDYLVSYDLSDPNSDILSLAISADGKYVSSGMVVKTTQQQIHLINTTDFDYRPMWKFNTSEDIDKMAISADGFYIVAAGDECAYLFNKTLPNAGQDKKEMWNVSFIPEQVEYFTSIDISADGKYIVVGVNDTDPECGFINVYNNSASKSKTYEYLWSYETEGIVTSVSITALGEYIVVGTEYDPHTGDDDENTVFLFSNTGYTLNEDHDPIWFFNTSNDVNSVSISAWGNFIGVGGKSTSGETFLFYHARPIPYVLRPYIAGDDDDDDDDVEPAIPFGNYYLLFAFVAIVALIVIKRRKTIQTKNQL